MKTVPFKRERIENAKRAIVLQITPADIKAAKPKDPEFCVIACAARRQFGAEDVRIHLSRVYIRRSNRWLRYMTGSALRRELIVFDRHGSFAPGDYYLAAITPSRQTGRQQGSSTSQSTYRQRRPYHYTDDVRPGARDELKAGRGVAEVLSPAP